MSSKSICFVVPDNSLAYQELSKSFSAIEPPTWALMLAESCRSKGASVSIIDCLPLKLTPLDVVKKIGEINPDIICFVVYGQNPNASSVNMSGVVEYSSVIKSNYPDLFNIVIGPHVAALPFQTLNLHSFIDSVSINEGIYTLHDLLQCPNLKDFTQISKVRGIVFRNFDDSSICYGAPGSVVPQHKIEEDLPGYAWDLLPYKNTPLDLYRSHLWHCGYDTENSSPFAAIYTSFGCIFKCSFCMINVINKDDYTENISASELNTMRFIPLSIIKKSLDFFAENNIKNIRICDEMFFLNTTHYSSILNYIVEKGYVFNMWAYARIDTIKQSQLELFKKAGVNWLGIGIESGSDLVRSASIKGAFSLNKIKNIIEKTRSSGISIGSNFIVGLPEDTVNTCQETAQLAIDLATEFINIYPCIDLPGSSIHVSSQKKEDGNYLKYGFLSYETIPNGTETLSPAEVLAIRDRLWLEIYSSPSVMKTIQENFGEDALSTLNRLKQIPLRRKLLAE